MSFALCILQHTAIIMDPVYGFHVFAHIGPKAETAETEFILKKLEQLNLQNAGVYGRKKVLQLKFTVNLI